MNPDAWRLPARLGAAAASGVLMFLAVPPVDVGWSVGDCGDDRADARLWLIRADHQQSWGGSCPFRPKQDG